jgi:hypothetical protein
MRILLSLGAMVPALALAAAPVSIQAQGATFNRYDAPTIGAPRAIVSADFNRDGFPDVALGGTARASIGIMFHHGFEEGDEGQRFKPVREIVVGGGPFELVAADVNRDGLVDIVVANADLHAVTVLLNDATHEFRTVLQTPVSDNPRGLAVADFNRDGIPDIVVTKYMGSTIEVLFGAGNGTFPTRRSHSAPASSQGIAAADFNHDGWMDAVVVSVTGIVSLYTMNAAGATREDMSRGHGWNVVTTGDFDRNGEIDVAYASTASSVVEVMYRHPNGSRTWNGDPMPVAASPRGIETADMNQDGTLDLVVAGRSASMATLLLRNGAAGHAYSRHDIAAGTGARDVTLVDFTGDGKIDMLTANEYGSSVSLLSNSLDMGPAPAFRFEALGVPDVFDNTTFDALDFDHNGKLDLVVRNRVIFDGTTGSRVLTQSGGFSTRGGAAGDFNNDGNPDVVYTDYRSFWVYFGDGDRGFVNGPGTSTGALEGWQLHAADMNRDGRLDVVVLASDFSSSGALQVYLGRGDGRFTFGGTSPVSYRARESALGDLDRDGILDAAVADTSGVHVLLGNGAGGWKSASIFEEGVPRFGVAIGDVTTDGIADLVMSDMRNETWGITWGSTVTVARGRGDGTFENIQQYELGQPGRFDVVYSLLLADINADGQLDIFTSNGHFLPGHGAPGNFGEPQRFDAGAFLGYLAADFNADGLLDLLGYWVGRTGEYIVMLNTRTPPSANRPPAGLYMRDTIHWPYDTRWQDDEESEIEAGRVSDPDLHAIRYTWTLNGAIVGHYETWTPAPNLRPGSYQVTVTADDYRGASISDTFTLEITPHKETVLHAWQADRYGAWQFVGDPTAAGDSEDARGRLWHPNANAPKLQTPLANPTDYVEFGFLADPTQEYKLWIRMKAENDSWANDSVFVQFTGAKDAAGNPIYALGSASALAVNLEECSGCGVSGWGWEDDGWGAPNRNGVTLRFPEGGAQIIRIQTREDGVSLDQVVLSSEKYLTTRPGPAKNDTTTLPSAGPQISTARYHQ